MEFLGNNRSAPAKTVSKQGFIPWICKLLGEHWRFDHTGWNPLYPVCAPRFVIHDTARLRGYRKMSDNRETGSFCSCGGLTGRSAGSISNAHARDFRASSIRPIWISHLGDSGTQALIRSVSSPGIVSIAKRRLHPTYGVAVAPSTAPSRIPTGTDAVTRPPTMPRFEAGTNSCTSGISTQ